MKLKPIDFNINLQWTRWTKYEIREVKDREGYTYEYIFPTARAIPVKYSCIDHAESLVADALELGHQIYIESPDVERLCLEFAARYGLLGTDAENSLLGVDVMGPELEPVSSRDYGEVFLIFQGELRELFEHFISVYDKSVSPYDSHVAELNGAMLYRILGGPSPQLVWEVQTMEAVLRFAYASMITTDPMPLKVCKNCGRIYYNAHAKSEFCSTRCRNYYNVKAFRQRGNG